MFWYSLFYKEVDTLAVDDNKMLTNEFLWNGIIGPLIGKGQLDSLQTVHSSVVWLCCLIILSLIRMCLFSLICEASANKIFTLSFVQL